MPMIDEPADRDPPPDAAGPSNIDPSNADTDPPARKPARRSRKNKTDTDTGDKPGTAGKKPARRRRASKTDRGDPERPSESARQPDAGGVDLFGQLVASPSTNNTEANEESNAADPPGRETSDAGEHTIQEPVAEAPGATANAVVERTSETAVPAPASPPVLPPPPAKASSANSEYRVLARKYRPRTFADMIGQEALVRTLSNAFATGRIAHAFVLTGVRGVGKTTTARIVARALNCIGPDGTGGSTITPCGRCEPCIAITEDRHVDVMEMDAASRTGVNDIREITDGVRYRPVSARYKVYIIDEVHMLSMPAFNALLKTLEEPPEHVKFIFATTEIRKLPVTVLSRCQRFDLRRVDAAALASHFAGIVEQEGAPVDSAALRLIARAADGSVRDGLSLLDQAIALSEGVVGEERVREMIGLADRSLVFDLLDATLTGRPDAALVQLGEMYAAGADPVTVLQDLMELVHWLTRARVSAESALGAEAVGLSNAERDNALALARKLSMPALTRAWQLLLKGLQECRTAPMPLQAAEMVLIRLAYAADLPDPANLVRQLTADRVGGAPPSDTGHGGGSQQAGSGVDATASPDRGVRVTDHPATAPRRIPTARSGDSHGAPSLSMDYNRQQPADSVDARLLEIQPGAPLQAAPAPDGGLAPDPGSFEDVAALFTARREGILAGYLINFARLVAFESGKVVLRFEGDVPTDLTGKIGRLLTDWTGRRWAIEQSDRPGAPTLREQQQAARDARLATAEQHPLVQAVLKTFPGAVIKAVRTAAEPPPSDAASAPNTGTDGNPED